MSMLHTVNKSPFERNALDSCIKHALPGSGILLIEDGVYAAVKGTAHEGMVRDSMANHSLYVLGPDLLARGMSPEQVIDGISVVDYGGFVDLAVNHDKVQSWL